ncbi:hypothetical protein BURPS1106B_A1090 [Burkholderia pseudomallei 1106b]|uniref:Uncharacterized protein n=2 Tax=Burkholderia pseudomallei TaxID=28450 RepID=A0A0E1W610_BURPE|nr:hypothetical protein BURPS1106A_1851 [Burkholderia pseudomallei 1106a]AFR15774.1 hypothetical protein BPC006_I1904 [Burkholderia pseudomallei BPC006]EDO92040.1 hypothetical protein BURPSPAST_AA0497 [Burkholderia pseudomallei Pasteur 52237]EDS87065.1 hypothetical protein BURPSS13_P0485 [Burkholderia pseudomallei S13]EES27201.1 hypothetical protein BURPS1106B_A1090 [Burkholderia pseudomallei 1106b]EET07736.1 hypothetical protein BURPS1710A_2294 [Burkholderia pseudomallei 1710a]
MSIARGRRGQPAGCRAGGPAVGVRCIQSGRSRNRGRPSFFRSRSNQENA